MSHVTPGNYQRRVLNGSGLDPHARFVALVLSRLAHSNADGYGWFDAPDSQIAEATALHRKTVANRIDALEQAGWLEVRPVVSGNRYQSTRYRLSLPIEAVQPKPERRKPGQFTTENQPSRGRSQRHLEPSSRGRSQRQHVAMGATTKYVSTSNVGDDGAPPSGGVGNDEKKIQTAPPAPAQPQAAGPPDAEPATEQFRQATPTAQLIEHGCDPDTVRRIGVLQRNQVLRLIAAGCTEPPDDQTSRTLYDRNHCPALIAALTPAQRLQLLNGVPVRPAKVSA